MIYHLMEFRLIALYPFPLTKDSFENLPGEQLVTLKGIEKRRLKVACVLPLWETKTKCLVEMSIKYIQQKAASEPHVVSF